MPIWRATDEARDTHELCAGRRYSMRSLPVSPPAAVATSSPLAPMGSTAAPSVVQTVVLKIVLGTRVTGTVTVSVIPHPAARTPSLTTVERDSTLRPTLGPTFAPN